MYIIRLVESILKKDNESARVLADMLEDNQCINPHPEFEYYHKKLLEPNKLRCQTVIDVVLKFGSPKERRIMAKAMRRTLRQHNKASKAVRRNWMKEKKGSLKFPWTQLIVENLINETGTIYLTD